jgi:hypothetical protein
MLPAHRRQVLDASCLALPMRQHHPVLVELICEGLDRRMARLQQLNGWAAQVAAQVRKDLQQQRPPSLEAAAEALHQSPCTLQLQGLNRSQIAEHLGYADSAAYFHARKRWQTDEP